MSAQTPYILVGISLVGLALILRHEAPSHDEPSPKAHAEMPESTNLALPTAPVEDAKPDLPKSPEEPSSPLLKEVGDFGRMADGSMVPPLPTDAPNKVRLGIALFRYQGAQGAAPGDRSREEALKLAERATEAAKEGFRRAIAQADPGSNEDIGWVKRGVLERRVEYQVFLLPTGTTSEKPIETPRGFWVVRRVR